MKSIHFKSLEVLDKAFIYHIEYDFLLQNLTLKIKKEQDNYIEFFKLCFNNVYQFEIINSQDITPNEIKIYEISFMKNDTNCIQINTFNNHNVIKVVCDHCELSLINVSQ